MNNAGIKAMKSLTGIFFFLSELNTKYPKTIKNIEIAESSCPHAINSPSVDKIAVSFQVISLFMYGIAKSSIIIPNMFR